MSNTETVRALVSAFNVNNYDFNAVKTNFTLQSKGKKDYIVVSFEKSMDEYQCRGYLNSIKRKIIREFYGIEESNDAEILDTAKLIFDVNSFPFNISDRDWSWDEQNGYKFVTPIDQGVIFNLKSHLASSLKKDVLEDMQIGSTTVPFNKRKYLCCSKFPDKESRQQFEHGFLSRMRERYENVPKKPLKVKGNSVYINDVFDDARFIDSVTRRVAWLIGRDLQADSKSRSDVRAFKDLIMEILDPSTRVVTSAFLCASPLNREEASILIPVILSNRGTRFLTKEEARDINHKFNNPVLDDISDKTQATFKVNGSSGIYGIDFSNKEISHCVITKIIESSVINKDHELSIDPERALSPVQSPFNSPTHAGPSGLRTPPNQRKKDTGSGYDSNSPPKKGSDSSSGGPGPSAKLSGMECEPSTHFQDGSISRLPNGHLDEAQLTQLRSPTGKSQGGALKESPRQGLEEPFMSHRGTSKEFSPRTYISSATVVSEPSSLLQSVGAAQNVQAGPSDRAQTINRWSLPASSAGLSLWQLSRPSSWKGANPVGANPWAQRTNPCLSQGTSENKWISSMQFTKPGPSGLSWSQSGPSSWKGAQAGANISKEEEKLIEALLYTFNLMNYTLDGVYTNFFAKNGKIVSLLHDNVDREEYLQAVINYIMEEYCGDEEEARELYDLDEFPFKLNCEEKQGKTVVANISSGALSNLKILFSQKFGKNVDTIDISAVKKVEKREKDEWVDRQLFNKDSLEEACEPCFSDEEAIEEACQDCFPDEGAMKIIPIAFEGGEYVLDRSRDTCEVNLLFKEQLRRFRATSLEKCKSSDKPLTKEEEKLFKKLLYAFNYSNNNFDCPDTNFIVKNGKITSLISDSVNVKEYLQKVRDKMKEEYCKDKKEAYDLNDFPFKFLSNCEKNQETTVVANINRGALFNLEKFFIYGYKEKVKIEKIDINIVKEAVKSKRHRLVELKAKEGIEREGGCYNRIKHCEAVTACYPDENALEDIPIGKYEAGYRLDRTYEPWETESLLEELKYAEDKSKAKKMKSEDNKDSGISSGEATDAENVSSKAEATTCSGYESMDCENTREGSPKRSGEEVVQTFKKQCIISTQIEDVTSESFGQRQGSIVG